MRDELLSRSRRQVFNHWLLHWQSFTPELSGKQTHHFQIQKGWAGHHSGLFVVQQWSKEQVKQQNIKRMRQR